MTADTVRNLTAALRSRGEPMYEGTPVDIGVPEHATLALRPGEWGPRPGQPDERYTDIRPVRTYQARGGNGWVIIGHVVCCECDPGSDEVCHLVWVTAAGLAAAAARAVAVPAPGAAE